MTILKRHFAGGFRAFVVIAALLAVLLVSTAALLPAHLHTGSAAARCDVCYTAHTTAYEESSIQPEAIPLAAGRTVHLLPVAEYQPQSRESSHSRGPPSPAL